MLVGAPRGLTALSPFPGPAPPPMAQQLHFGGWPRPGLPLLQVGLCPSLSSPSPGSLTCSEDQLPRKDRACSCHQCCQHHGTLSSACPRAWGSMPACQPHIFQPHRPLWFHTGPLTAVTAHPSTWHGGSTERAAGSQAHSFWILC